MGRALLLRVAMVGALAALVAWDGSLLEAQREARDTSQRIGRLLSAEERQAMLVAAVSLRAPDGASWLYGRFDGMWRCLDHHLAPADGAAIGRLVDDLLAAEGVVQSDDVDRAADYGLDGERMWQVRLHGRAVMQDPQQDLLFSADVGDPVPGLEGCYLRRTGTPAVWAVDTSPRGPLDEARPPGAPPLLDPHVVPAGFPTEGQRLSRVVVQRADGVAFALVVRKTDVSEEALMQGASPYRWVIEHPDGSEADPHPMLAVFFVNFLKLAPWTEVLDRGRAEELGLASPRGLLILEDGAGKTAELVLAPSDAQGAALANRFSNALLRVAPEVADLMLPEPEQLIDGDVGNPWQPWLEASGLAAPRRR